MQESDIPTGAEIVGKLRKHGFLLEEQIAEYFDRPEVAERWFTWVETERAFHFPDPDEGKSREIDVKVEGFLDHQGQPFESSAEEGPACELTLLIECKYSQVPHVLLSRDIQWCPGSMVSPLAPPVREAEPYLDWPTGDLATWLGLSRIAHQVVRVTKHDASSALSDFTASLVKCAAHFRNDAMVAATWEDYFADEFHRSLPPRYRHVSPILVINAPLIELRQGAMETTECSWMPLCCSYHSAALNTRGYVVIDVVHSACFEQYFESVLLPRANRGWEVIERQYGTVRIPPIPEMPPMPE